MTSEQQSTIRLFVWLLLFATAFAFVESTVVLYLRAIYYPGGFDFPLRLVSDEHLVAELVRECATIIMLIAAGILAGRTAWQRFGFFLFAFGVWDIFYYIWLKVLLDWPKAFTDWDVLFLLPVPWIGPVIAPLLISSGMVVCGILIVTRVSGGRLFQPGLPSWILSTSATVIILYSFVGDLAATLKGAMPQPYDYWFLAVGLILYAGACGLACQGNSSADAHD